MDSRSQAAFALVILAQAAHSVGTAPLLIAASPYLGGRLLAANPAEAGK